jgi:hypothetical protein
MGAICYDQDRLEEGRYWFEEAIKRGASPKDIDAELKQIVKNTKDRQKRKKVIEYLLKEDSRRYAWAKHYLSKDNQ